MKPRRPWRPPTPTPSRAGWSGAELAQFGVRKPERRAPGRPRTARKPAATAAPTPSSSDNIQAD